LSALASRSGVTSAAKPGAATMADAPASSNVRMLWVMGFLLDCLAPPHPEERARVSRARVSKDGAATCGRLMVPSCFEMDPHEGRNRALLTARTRTAWSGCASHAAPACAYAGAW